MSFTLCTRGSALALWQADRARAALAAAGPPDEVALLEVRSSGDLDAHTALARFGRFGIFTAEVDRAVLDGRGRVGVHSLKDMTTTLEEGVVLGGVLPRGPIEDVVVGRRLDALAPGARVATGSARRRAMLLCERGDLAVVGIRGNVGTRLAKLDAGAADALLMARAGLERLGLAGRVAEVLPVDRFLPAVGQGIVGLTCRAGDAEALALLRRASDPATWAAALAERAFLRALHGGCSAPVGGHAEVDGEALALRGRVLAPDGSRCVAGERSGRVADAEALGADLAAELLARGAGTLLEEARP